MRDVREEVQLRFVELLLLLLTQLMRQGNLLLAIPSPD